MKREISLGGRQEETRRKQTHEVKAVGSTGRDRVRSIFIPPDQFRTGRHNILEVGVLGWGGGLDWAGS